MMIKEQIKDKRFLVFLFDNHYPGGGMGDCSNSFDTLDKAIEFSEIEYYENIEIYDRIEGVIAYEK